MAAHKRARSARHPQLEFEVDFRNDRFGYKTFEEAATAAISISVSHGIPVTIDVLTFSRAAAKAWAGDHGVEVYNEDPEASVHERIVVRAESQGRIA